MHRRLFLQQAFATSLLAREWKSPPPRDYLAELTTLMRAAPVPGAVIGSVRGGRVVWIVPLGVQAAGAPAPVTASTLFQAASLTKQVTAYVAFALRAQGKLDFDRTLVSYLDDLPGAVARTVAVRHVLSHSSGFPNWRFARADQPVPDLVPAFAPGSRYQYSGEGYFYLQRVLERITGKGFGQLVQDEVFGPLGMASSTLAWAPETLGRTAVPHNNRGEIRSGWDKASRALRAWADRAGKPVEQLRYEDYSAVVREAGNPALPNWMIPNAASSLMVSAEDYARFLIAAAGNPDIGREQVRINEFLGWGLGWAIERVSARTYLWQWGDNPGFKNIVLAEPASGSAYFVFTNGDAGARVYDRVITHATGLDHPALFWL
jgi:CubicO group peptidase (beta-lactamase class C family)